MAGNSAALATVLAACVRTTTSHTSILYVVSVVMANGSSIWLVIHLPSTPICQKMTSYIFDKSCMLRLDTDAYHTAVTFIHHIMSQLRVESVYVCVCARALARDVFARSRRATWIESHAHIHARAHTQQDGNRIGLFELYADLAAGRRTLR